MCCECPGPLLSPHHLAPDHMWISETISQTIPECAIIVLDYHSHDTILFWTMCRSWKKNSQATLECDVNIPLHSCHLVAADHLWNALVPFLNLLFLFCTQWLSHSPQLDLFNSPESLCKWLSTSRVISFTC